MFSKIYLLFIVISKIKTVVFIYMYSLHVTSTLQRMQPEEIIPKGTEFEYIKKFICFYLFIYLMDIAFGRSRY